MRLKYLCFKAMGSSPGQGGHEGGVPPEGPATGACYACASTCDDFDAHACVLSWVRAHTCARMCIHIFLMCTRARECLCVCAYAPLLHNTGTGAVAGTSRQGDPSDVGPPPPDPSSSETGILTVTLVRAFNLEVGSEPLHSPTSLSCGNRSCLVSFSLSQSRARGGVGMGCRGRGACDWCHSAGECDGVVCAHMHLHVHVSIRGRGGGRRVKANKRERGGV